MGAQAVLAVLLFTIGTVKAADGEVSFWRENFKMTCPGEGTWYKIDEGQIITNDSKNHERQYNGTSKGGYYCEYTKEGGTRQKYYFYVQGKACENCFEMEASFLMLAIIVDVVMTGFVMMIIYRCTKKKSSPAPHSSKAPPARSGGRAPPVPSPDYEQLNPQTRGQDTYSLLNRTG
eukprot:superscaffoldBa00000015_g293